MFKFTICLQIERKMRLKLRYNGKSYEINVGIPLSYNNIVLAVQVSFLEIIDGIG